MTRKGKCTTPDEERHAVACPRGSEAEAAEARDNKEVVRKVGRQEERRWKRQVKSKMPSARSVVVALATVVVGLLGLAQHVVGVDCSIWQECDPRSRRILFILDGSLSISSTRFNNEMMDYVINTFCGFRNTAEGAKYEAGVITFNQQVRTRVPFEELTPNAFETKVKNKVKNKVPLSCCTTHAEAAIHAKEMFEEAGLDDGYENIAFFVTDGAPFINYRAGTYGVKDSSYAKNWYESRGLDWKGYWTQDKAKAPRDEERVLYATETVPRYMKELKDIGVRVFFIGVPHSNPLKPVNIDYFTGRQTNVCYENNDVNPSQTSCRDMDYMPLVSEPVDDHAFSVTDWDLSPLVTESLLKICKAWTPPTQCLEIPRDLMILVDTSDSMDPERYVFEMMEIVKAAADNLDFNSGSRVGVATFGAQENTVVRIPLTNFADIEDFYTAVDANVRLAPLECCTNHAEAFEEMQGYFRRNFIDGHDKILLVVTDGTPFQNYGFDKWQWRAPEWKTRLNRCDYTIETVPTAAQALKDDGVRIVLAGVPNRNERAPLADFFDGALDGEQCCVNADTNKASLIQGDAVWTSENFDSNADVVCRTYTDAKVVSDGDNNVFVAENWDVASITASISNMICQAEPTVTPPPTMHVPTKSPTTANRPGREEVPPSPRNPSLEAIDVVFVVDTGALANGQADRCRSNGSFESCKQQMFNFANQMRKQIYAEVSKGDLGFALVVSDCGGAKPIRRGWTRKFTEMTRKIRRGRKMSLGGDKCLANGLTRAETLLNGRTNQNRKGAVVVLTHDGTITDVSSAASKASDIRGVDGITTYVASVGQITGSHQSNVNSIAGDSSRVCNALTSNGLDKCITHFEGRLSL
ncbi:Collagen alpha-5VI chain [Durusdinium trenchii]|uniref:Collagen alpha-5VI chain n=1 Tax=Durusdinium trenchii TaxID=1381693 RepID=A0ABP0SEF9_9DINO